jgi:hypothetical protein
LSSTQGKVDQGAPSSRGKEVSGHDFSRAEEGQGNERALAPEGSLPADLPEPAARASKLPRGLLESRLETILENLTAPIAPPNAVVRQAHLALLKRWYYRPEIRRTGEVFFPDPEGRWPTRQILRGIGRVAAKSLIPAGRA